MGMGNLPLILVKKGIVRLTRDNVKSFIAACNVKMRDIETNEWV